MGTETLNSYTSTCVTLTAAGAYNSPFTVTAAGTIDASGSNAVQSTLAAPYLLNLGTISSTEKYGVFFDNGGTVTNSGAAAKIYGSVSGVAVTGAATVTNTGTITGASQDGVYLYSGGTMTNSASYSAITGGKIGVDVINAPGYVTNAGTIRGPGEVGILLFAGTVTNSGGEALIYGGAFGVAVEGAATVTNTGTITGASEVGVYLYSGGTITNGASYSVITGGVLGAEIKNAAGSVTNAGTITGGDCGVYFTAAGTVTNTGTITGSEIGVLVEAGGTVSNTGTAAVIYGGISGAEIKNAAGSVSNAGTITGGDCGVYFTAVGTVTNTGTITGSEFGVLVNAAGSVSNTGTAALIYGGHFGVFMEGAATVTNTGTITGAATYGVYLNAGGTVSNSASYAFISGSQAGVEIKHEAGQVLNAGTITGGHFGVDLAAGGTVSNTGTAAVIYGSGVGVLAQGAATLTNAGTITGASDIGEGVYFGAGGTVTNSASNAVIAGGSDGVLIDNARGYVANTGTITGANFVGVELYNGGSVTNIASQALISGHNYGVLVVNAPGYVTNAGTISGGKFGLFLFSGGTVTNTGIISGGDFGVLPEGAGGVIINAGTITASINGVVLEDSGTVVNTGIIAASEDAGIFLAGGGTVQNAGTIAGDGTAVTFSGSPSDRLIIDPGASFGGTISGGTGLNILELAGPSTVYRNGSSYYYADGVITNTLASQYVGFNQITIDAGAYWTLEQDIGAGITINNAGYLILSSASFTNAGVIYSSENSPVFIGGTFTNTGTLINTNLQGDGIDLVPRATIANAGSIFGATGIQSGGGVILNTGTVTGGSAGVVEKTPPSSKVGGSGTPGTVVNSGSISGDQGVQLANGGTVINTGTITGTDGDGVNIAGGGTVVNAGMIASANGYSVQFYNAARLVLDPGASFDGSVQGGTGPNILELAGPSTIYRNGSSYSYYYGNIANTLASQYAGFNQITVDPGADWTLEQDIGAGITITNSGALFLGHTHSTFTNAGVIQSGAAGALSTNVLAAAVNTGTIIGTQGYALNFQGDTLFNAGDISGAAGVSVTSVGVVVGLRVLVPTSVTLVNGGTITGNDGVAVKFQFAVSDRLVVDPGAVFNGTVSGSAGVNTLELAGPSTVYRNGSSYHYADGVISNTLASQYVGFNQVTVDAGASWSLYQDIGAGITITNSGQLSLLPSAGTLTNAGVIISNAGGALLAPSGMEAGIGTIVNTGTITSTQGYAISDTGGDVFLNSGSILGAGGVAIAGLKVATFNKVTNRLDYAYYPATLVNSGTITGTNGTAVAFTGVDDARLVIDPGAVFNGTVSGVAGMNFLELAAGSAPGTIASALASQYVNFNQITVDSGAYWTLEQAIGAGITITNSGSIINQNGYNLQFLSGGKVFNSGTIGGAEGVQVKGGAGYLANTGIINVEGLEILPKGAGAPPSSFDFAAIALFDGGTVVNSGTVSASQNTGISLLDGGTLINTGTVLGESFGVFASGGTVLNAGTISGADGQAVRFQGSTSDRLILDPGASFYGTVSGGTGINILELAAPANSHDRGVIADSLASQYVGFNQVTVDAGAYWALYQGIGPGITITNAGELLLQDVPPPGLIPIGGFGAGNPYPVFINAGVIYSGASGALNMQLTTAVNTGTIIGTQGYALYFQGFTLYNSGEIGGAAGVSLTSAAEFEKPQFTSVTLVNSGTITGSDGVAVKFGSVGYGRLVIDPGAVIQGTVAGGTGINTLELAGPTTVYRNGYSYYYNSGVISNTLASQYVGFNQVKVDAGANWTLEQDIGAGITITNAGQLSLLPSADTLTNAGVIVSTAAGKLTVAPPRIGVIGVQMFNTGTILAAQGYGLALSRGTLVNSGSIGGPAGVELEGVKVETGFNPGQPATYTYFRSTLVNSGTITGTNGTAVEFTGLDKARLVIDPGAVFNGTVSGVAGVNTLELAAGAGIGTIANLAARYVNFGDVIIDSGAEWQLGGTIGAGGSAVNLGALLGASSSLSSGTAPAGLAATGATLDNAGLITGGDAYGLSGLGGIGVSLTGGALTNTGNIYGGYAYGREGAGGAGAVLDGGIFANTGRITGGKLDVQAGNAPGAAGAGVMLAAGTLITSGTITGGVKTATDTRSDAVQFAGAAVLIVESGADFIGQVAADSTADILEVSGTSADALAGIGTAFTGFSQISFAAGAAWTLSGNSLGLADGEIITGFTFGDKLDLTGFSGTSETFSNGALTLSNGATREILDLAGAAPTDHFSISSDGSGGTDIAEVTCFVAGTRIATARGEVPVEALAIGDQVRTLHAGLRPIKWIGTRSYAAPFCNHKKVLPIRIRAGALADGVPSRDLLVSPGHAILAGGALIHAARLVNGVSITQLKSVETVTYYHIELETHEVVFAENCPAETFMGEVFRPQFQNAESFSALYPGDKAPEKSSVPFLSRGFQMAAILRRLRARAGIAAPVRPGPLRGQVDVCTPAMVSGWAQDRAAPNEPVILDILAEGRKIGRVIANIHRPDVAAAGYGAGHNGFEFPLPLGTTGAITIRRGTDRAMLPATARSQAA